LVLLGRVRKRRDFIAARAGRRFHRDGFVLQTVPAQPGNGSSDSADFGYTLTRKVGNAVVRNRIRRRLREAVRLAAPGRVAGGEAFVIIGKQAALHLPFEQLANDLIFGLDRIGAKSSKSAQQSSAVPKKPKSASTGKPVRAENHEK